MPADQRRADGSSACGLKAMGKGSRPAKAKTIVLVPGIGGSVDKMQPGATAVAMAGVEQQAPPSLPESVSAWAGPTSSPPSQPEPQQEVVEPSLAELQALKEQIRKEHPSWYAEYRDTLGHQFNEQ